MSRRRGGFGGANDRRSPTASPSGCVRRRGLGVDLWGTPCGLGCRLVVGLDPVQARAAFAKTPFLVYDLVAGGLCGLGVLVALALAMPWGRRLPRARIGLLAWGGTGLLVLRSIGSVIQALYLAGRGRFVVGPHTLWEVWFYLGAALFFLGTWRYWRQPDPPANPRRHRGRNDPWLVPSHRS